MKRINLLFDQEIDIGIPLSGYRLIPGYSGEFGLPVEVFLHLYAVRDKVDVKLISQPGHLSPLIEHISSEDEAWRFLRLFTAPDTHYLFQKDIYSIDIGVSTPSEPPRIGMISWDLAQRVGFRPPEIRLVDQEYIACRDLVRANPIDLSAKVLVIRRCEALSVDGVYRFIEERKAGEIARKDLPFPAYE
jgi:hypothetical protein